MMSGCLGVFNMNGGREGYHIVSYCWLVISCYTPWNTMEIPLNPQWQMESNTIKHHITWNTINSTYIVHQPWRQALSATAWAGIRSRRRSRKERRRWGEGPGRSPQCHNMFSSKVPQKTGKVNQNGWILNVRNIFKLDYLDFSIVLGGCYDDK